MTLPGETEAGSAGKQPCQGIAWWKLIADDEREGDRNCRSPFIHRIDRFPDALKIPARRAEHSLTQIGFTPIPAEPRQIVAVYNGLVVSGTVAVVSTDGGNTWSAGQVSTALTGFGRVVASGNTFHVLFVDTGSDPTWALKRIQSTDGISWTSPVTLDTFTRPRLYSPENYPTGCTGGVCGRVFYATAIPGVTRPLGFVDASASAGLGWVVVYAVARVDDPSITNLKYCVESSGGCGTISYGTDLFQAGITTSDSMDFWINTLTYNSLPRTLPLNQVVVYRQPSGNFLNAVIRSDIDPTKWRYVTQDGRCDGLNCYGAGDYMRPAQNGYTSATIPFILQSSPDCCNNLMQSFVQDPQQGLSPLPGLQVGMVRPFGQDSTSKQPLPPFPPNKPFTRRGPY